MKAVRRSLLALFVLLLASPAMGVGGAADGWVEVDYSSLVDRRQLTHSGESVGALLDRLAGGQLDADASRLAFALLDPLLEPMAFVLPDALDTLEGAPEREMVEVGWLWEPGEAAPAWVEVLRARKWLLESDGAGTLRLFLPAAEDGRSSEQAARQAFERQWPALLHPLAAEWRRLAARAGASEALSLEVKIYPYRHDLAHSRFLLGRQPWQHTLTATTPGPPARPVDLTVFEPFLGGEGWQLEGARLRKGRLVLTGSPRSQRPPMPGGPLTLADVAVAYRAVFHGSLAPPYMSLDRSPWPDRLAVNFGGRLADTRMGWISLLCDARFKTFSTGFGPRTWLDRRPAIVQRVPDFLTHVERFAKDPRSVGSSGQQTRLWFYPDEVDLTLSPQGDLLALRRVRLAAAAEKVGGQGASGRSRSVAPWTRALTRQINASYDALAQVFPELEGLDQFSRLLALFTWLRHLKDAGMEIGDFDPLLAVPLRAFPTPRAFPQMVVVPAIPASGPGAIDVFPRLPVVRAMDRLRPRFGGLLPAPARLQTVRNVLDGKHRAEARVLAEMARVGGAGLTEEAIDGLVFEAERVRLHRLALATVGQQARQRLLARHQGGEKLRVFSLSIGGLDLDFSRAVAKARSVSIGLPGAVARPAPLPAAVEPSARRGAAAAERRTWLAVASQPSPAVMPDHGRLAPSSRRLVMERQLAGKTNALRGGFRQVDLQPFSPWRHLRRLELAPNGRVRGVIRIEAGRSLHFRFASLRGGLSARLLPWPAGPEWPAAAPVGDPDSGLRVARLAPSAQPGGLRLELPTEGPDPAWVELGARSARRLLMGPQVDLAPAGTEVPSLVPPGGPLAGIKTLLLELPPRLSDPLGPGPEPLAPTLDPLRVAPALNSWWKDSDTAVAVLARGGQGIAARKRLRATGRYPLLLLPAGGLEGAGADWGQRLAAVWKGPVQRGTPSGKVPPLVLYVTAQPPGLAWEAIGRLAGERVMKGRALAVLSVSGEGAAGAAPRTLQASTLAGLGVAWRQVGDEAALLEDLLAWAEAVRAAEEPVPEAVPVPLFTWLY